MTVIDDTSAVDLSRVPGAMQDYKTRDLPDGSRIVFEQAPYGWLKKDGNPRLKDWRAYFMEPVEGKRQRLISVTTLLDAILPKGGLPVWAEARGIEGTLTAVRRGLINPDDQDVDPVRVVRDARLGADSARDQAATRGLNVHSLLEAYMLTGAPPRLGDHLPEHHGYIQALTRWLLKTNPEPVLIEELVCDAPAGYAGRMDLLARTGGYLTAYDAKTQEKGGIYNSAHVQLGLYVRGHVACGGEEPSFQKVVVFAANGEFREMDSACTPALVEVALTFASALKPVTSACDSANYAEKKARASA